MKKSLIAALLATASLHASATVINFDSNAAQSYFVSSVSSNGFIVKPSASGDHDLGTSNNFDYRNFALNGSVYLSTWSNSYNNTGFTLSSTDGATFSLQGFDFDNAYSSGQRTSTITVTGLSANNTTVSQTVSNLTSVTAWTSFNVNPNFTNLKSVTFTATGDGSVRALYDNIVVNNAVPEPGSIALLGLGIAGLAMSRRKKA